MPSVSAVKSVAPVEIMPVSAPEAADFTHAQRMAPRACTLGLSSSAAAAGVAAASRAARRDRLRFR